MRFTSIIPLTTALGIASAAQVYADTNHVGGYGGHMWNGGYGSFLGAGAMGLFWIAVIALIVIAVRWGVNKDVTRNAEDSALVILKERLAKGEIDPAEYEERRKVLDK